MLRSRGSSTEAFRSRHEDVARGRHLKLPTSPLERQISDANVLKQSVRYSIPVPAPRVMVGDRRRRPPTQRKVPPIPQWTMWRCSLSEQSMTRGADGRLGSGHGPVSPNDSKASRTDCFRHLGQLTNSGDEIVEGEGMRRDV